MWNLRTSQKLHDFSGWGFGVTCIEQTPALDLVGIGLQNGSIIIFNILTDKAIMRFQQDWGPVTGLAFRTGIIPNDCACVSAVVLYLDVPPHLFL